MHLKQDLVNVYWAIYLVNICPSLLDYVFQKDRFCIVHVAYCQISSYCEAFIYIEL
jgi:hypothetical protein